MLGGVKVVDLKIIAYINLRILNGLEVAIQKFKFRLELFFSCREICVYDLNVSIFFFYRLYYIYFLYCEDYMR